MVVLRRIHQLDVVEDIRTSTEEVKSIHRLKVELLPQKRTVFRKLSGDALVRIRHEGNGKKRKTSKEVAVRNTNHLKIRNLIICEMLRLDKR
jgi:hypothetical protein